MSRVLLPSDGSANSQYGVRHVISEFMKSRDLEIHVLNVQPPFSKHVGRFSSSRARSEFHQEQAASALKPVRQALDSSGIPYTVHTEVGDKADCIATAARRLQVGLLHINDASSSRVDLIPFGGVKQSGIGREGPRYAMLEMTEERLVTFNLA